jgi:hypothetical protein
MGRCVAGRSQRFCAGMRSRRRPRLGRVAASATVEPLTAVGPQASGGRTRRRARDSGCLQISRAAGGTWPSADTRKPLDAAPPYPPRDDSVWPLAARRLAPCARVPACNRRHRLTTARLEHSPRRQRDRRRKPPCAARSLCAGESELSGQAPGWVKNLDSAGPNCVVGRGSCSPRS